MITIRDETESDWIAVFQVIEAAFGRQAEASLVDTLRLASSPYISLVAEQDSTIIGHIYFSIVSIESAGDSFEAIGLGPLSVLPAYQNQGAGSLLVSKGLEACKRLGHNVVVVLGHPLYYPRFGFVPASRRNLACEYQVPDEVFMVVELAPGSLDDRHGVVKYHPAFSSV